MFQVYLFIVQITKKKKKMERSNIFGTQGSLFLILRRKLLKCQSSVFYGGTFACTKLVKSQCEYKLDGQAQ